MKVAILGAGYLGHGIGVCLPEIGNDVDARKVDTLRRGEISTHEREHGREAPVHSNAAAGRRKFAQDAAAAVAHGTMQTLGVGRHLMKTARPICSTCWRPRAALTA